MKKIVWPLIIALTVACASAPTVQRVEYNTVASAQAGVEAARSAYQDISIACKANMAYSTLCPGVISSHDNLAKSYGVYAQALKTLADANIAALATGAAPDAGTKVAAAAAGLLQAASDFVTLEQTIKGGK